MIPSASTSNSTYSIFAFTPQHCSLVTEVFSYVHNTYNCIVATMIKNSQSNKQIPV